MLPVWTERNATEARAFSTKLQKHGRAGVRDTHGGGPGCGHSHDGAAARNVRYPREISAQCTEIRENALLGSERYKNTKNPSPGREICRSQTRPAKFVNSIQNIWVYLYAPRLGPAHCPGESCTVRGRKPAGAFARPPAARTLGGLLRMFCPHRGPAGEGVFAALRPWFGKLYLRPEQQVGEEAPHGAAEEALR
jgi:hypothetical protein